MCVRCVCAACAAAVNKGWQKERPQSDHGTLAVELQSSHRRPFLEARERERKDEMSEKSWNRG